MATLTAFIKRDWEQFRHDPPGHRFENHTDRVARGPRAAGGLQLVAGIFVFAIGLLLLVIPGPGLPFVGIGLAMLAGRSRRVARGLDHAELRARGALRRIRAKLHRK